MRKTLKIVSLSLLAIVFLIPPLFASPFARPSSLINTPTSDILGKGEVEVGISALGQEDVFLEADGWINFGLCDKVELGLILLTPYEAVANAKFQILQEKDKRPALSVGILNITDKERITSTGNDSLWDPMNYTLYAVLGKKIPHLGRGYLGIGNRWFKAHGSEDTEGSGIFFGIEKEFKPLTLIAEFDGKYPNLGMEFDLSRGLKLKTAISELRYLDEKYEDDAPKEIKFALGLTFSNKASLDTRKELKKVQKQLTALKTRVGRMRKKVRERTRRRREKPEVYIVKKGDCLWFIAGYEQIYGNPFLWRRIFNANRDQIKNPDLIYPYQRLAIPRD